MITGSEFYKVMSSVVPLYVAMILAYGSVRWWKVLSPDQCSGINRFVSIFAVPLLSFEIIANNNPYKMNGKFIAADAIQKVLIFVALGFWAHFTKRGSLDWLITLFMVATLPNTLVMGIPLLNAMYGEHYGSLVVQAVVLQCILWYTLLLFLYEYRSAKLLILQQFPETAASIVSFKLDRDVISLDGPRPVQTEAEVREDGKIHVKVKLSPSSSLSQDVNSLVTPLRSPGLASASSSKAATPRASNLIGAEIYSFHSSTNITPRQASLDHSDFCQILSNRNAGSPLRPANLLPSEMSSNRSSKVASPRLPSILYAGEQNYIQPAHPFANTGNSSSNGLGFISAKQSIASGMSLSAPRTPRDSFGRIEGNNLLNIRGGTDEHLKVRNTEGFSPNVVQISRQIGEAKGSSRIDTDSRELHMFVWSSSASPVSDSGKHALRGIEYANADASKHDFDPEDQNIMLLPSNDDGLDEAEEESKHVLEDNVNNDFSFLENEVLRKSFLVEAEALDNPTNPNGCLPMTCGSKQRQFCEQPRTLPPPSVMVKLILDMVWRKLIRNPNTYSSLLGLVWSLISFRWHVKLPIIVDQSIKILSNAGLGMAMFSLGLFMALQSRLLACGTSLALLGMIVRFLIGPAVMAAGSIAVGLRSTALRASIVQASLPQGIVPFVFAKEYNVHPDVLSTAVIFGMLVSFPITLVYYLLLGL